MSNSYNRRCKYCSTWIQMRQMPHGQWVPFEGYNTVHKCRNTNQKRSQNSNKTYAFATPYSNKTLNHLKNDEFGIGIPEITVKQKIPNQPKNKIAFSTSNSSSYVSSVSNFSPNSRQYYKKPNKNKSGLPAWAFVLIFFVCAYFMPLIFE